MTRVAVAGCEHRDAGGGGATGSDRFRRLGWRYYDAASRTLVVKFKSGGVYEYYDVEPALYEELLRSQPHPWSVVGEEVKAHRFRRIGED